MKKETQVRFSSSQKIVPIEKPTKEEFKLFSELVLKDLGLEWGEDKKLSSTCKGSTENTNPPNENM